MAEDTFKNMIFAFIMVSLFSVLVLTAIIYPASVYNKDISELGSGSLSLIEFNESISGVESKAESLQETFRSGNIFSIIAGVVVNGIFGIGFQLFDFILLPFNLVSNIAVNILGVPSYVKSVIMGLLILAVIFAIWRLIKIGD